jgi:hypothetical protein
MSIVELQINSATFLAAQRNALRNLDLCPPRLPAIAGVEFVIDRVEIGANSLRHDDERQFDVFFEDHGERKGVPIPCMGFQTQLEQDVTLHLTTMGEVLARANQAPSVTVPVRFTLLFDLDFYALEEECYLRAALNEVALGPLPPLPPPFSPHITLPPEVQTAIADFLTAQVRPFMPTMTLPSGLGLMRSEAKLGKFLNAGISVDTNLQRLVLRAQIGGSYDRLDVPWSNFFHGFIPDRLQGRSWSFFVEAGLLTETVKTKIYAELPTDDSLEAFPGCTYFARNGRAVLSADILLIYHLYRNRDIDIDIDVQAHPRVDLTLWVDTPNWLEIEFDFAHLLDTDDPLIELALGLVHLFGVPVESLIFNLVGGAAATKLSGTPVQNVKRVSQTKIHCDFPIRLPQVPGALQTALTSLLALEDGVALAGTMTVRELTTASLAIEVNEFKVAAPSITCGPASMALVALFRQDPSAFAVLHAKAFLTNLGTAPLSLCQVPAVLRGAEGPFPQSAISVDDWHAPLQVSVHMATPPASYYSGERFTLDLLARTSGGTRLIRFAAPPETEGNQDNLAAELLAKIADCEQLVDPFFGGGRYNPKWSPRPVEDVLAMHQWEIRVSGLRGGEAMAVRDAGGHELAAAIGGKTVQLSMITEAAEGPELSIERVQGFRQNLAAGSEGGERGLEIRQTMLLQTAVVPLASACQRLLVSRTSNRPHIVAALDDAVTVIPLGSSGLPTGVRTWSIPKVRGLINWDGRLVAFGAGGLERVDTESGRIETIERCGLGEVLGATASRASLHALTADGVRSYSADGCELGKVAIRGGRSIVSVRGGLVVGGDEGLALVDPSACELVDRMGSDKPFVDLRASPPGEPGLFIALFADGTGSAFDVDRHGFAEVARLGREPWHASSARIGPVVACIGSGRRHVEFYRRGESVDVTSREDRKRLSASGRPRTSRATDSRRKR